MEHKGELRARLWLPQIVAPKGAAGVNQPTSLRVRPSLIALGTQAVAYILPLTLGFVALNQGLFYLPDNTFSEFSSKALRWIYGVARLVIILELVRLYLNSLYLFEIPRVSGHRGLLSFNYRVSTVKYEDVREIKVEQSILGRILNYGTVLVGTAARSGYELEIRNVARPLEISHLLHKLRQNSRRRDQLEHSLSSRTGS